MIGRMLSVHTWYLAMHKIEMGLTRWLISFDIVQYLCLCVTMKTISRIVSVQDSLVNVVRRSVTTIRGIH